MLRYKKTYGENPSDGQMLKMMQISQDLEHKKYIYHFHSSDASESEFLHPREGVLLFKHEPSDTSRDLDFSQQQVQKTFEHIERQMRLERENMNQKEMSL